VAELLLARLSIDKILSSETRAVWQCPRPSHLGGKMQSTVVRCDKIKVWGCRCSALYQCRMRSKGSRDQTGTLEERQ
jgi:hypothetical protein